MNGHGGFRPGAGRKPLSLVQVRDVAENVLAMLADADADLERLRVRHGMLRAYAVAVANNPRATPSVGELREAA